MHNLISEVFVGAQALNSFAFNCFQKICSQNYIGIVQTSYFLSFSMKRFSEREKRGGLLLGFLSQQSKLLYLHGLKSKVTRW